MRMLVALALLMLCGAGCDCEKRLPVEELGCVTVQVRDGDGEPVVGVTVIMELRDAEVGRLVRP